HKEHPAPHSLPRYCCPPCLLEAYRGGLDSTEVDEHAVSVIQRDLERTMQGFPYTCKWRREFAVANTKESKIRITLCDIMLTIGPGRLRTRFLGTSNDYRLAANPMVTCIRGIFALKKCCVF
ncbi:hypothetical protein V3C99_006804, partial [Haemonchus contortus]